VPLRGLEATSVYKSTILNEHEQQQSKSKTLQISTAQIYMILSAVDQLLWSDLWREVNFSTKRLVRIEPEKCWIQGSCYKLNSGAKKDMFLIQGPKIKQQKLLLPWEKLQKYCQHRCQSQWQHQPQKLKRKCIMITLITSC